MLPCLPNAYVTSVVYATGAVNPYADSGADTAPVFTGNLGCYISEKSVRSYKGGNVTYAKATQAFIPCEVGDLEPDYVVSITEWTGAVTTYRVLSVSDKRMPFGVVAYYVAGLVRSDVDG